MFGVNWMELLTLIGIGGVGAAIIIYFALRVFVWGRVESKSIDYIRKHAWWTGVIAWMFSSLAAAGQTGTYHYGQAAQPDTPWAFIPWFSLLGPVAAVLAVHAVGQATWPAPKSAKRVATLEFRRVRDYIEPSLGWTVLGAFLFTGAVMPFVAMAPGFQAVSSPPPGTLSAWTIGKVDGWVVAAALSLALLLLAAGTLLTMRLIVSRGSLENLSPEQNKTLRIIGMNRLLRVSATVASGLAAIAGNYLAQPEPGSDTTSWTNWLGLVNMAVLVTMFFWKPPALDPASPFGSVPEASGMRPSRESFAAARLMDSATVVLVPAMVIGVLLGLWVRPWLGWMGIITAALSTMVLAHLGLEFVLRRNYALSVEPGQRRTASLRGALPRFAWIGFALSVLALLGTLSYAALATGGSIPPRWDGISNPAALFLVPGALAGLILLIGAAAMWFVLARPPLRRVPAALDATLRSRSLFRIARTVTSCWFALSGLLLSMAGPLGSAHPAPTFDPSILAALLFALALISVFLPARKFKDADFAPSKVPSAGR